MGTVDKARGELTDSITWALQCVGRESTASLEQLGADVRGKIDALILAHLDAREAGRAATACGGCGHLPHGQQNCEYLLQGVPCTCDGHALHQSQARLGAEPWFDKCQTLDCQAWSTWRVVEASGRVVRGSHNCDEHRPAGQALIWRGEKYEHRDPFRAAAPAATERAAGWPDVWVAFEGAKRHIYHAWLSEDEARSHAPDPDKLIPEPVHYVPSTREFRDLQDRLDAALRRAEAAEYGLREDGAPAGSAMCRATDEHTTFGRLECTRLVGHTGQHSSSLYGAKAYWPQVPGEEKPAPAASKPDECPHCPRCGGNMSVLDVGGQRVGQVCSGCWSMAGKLTAADATIAQLRAEVTKYESVANPAKVAVEAMAERDAAIRRAEAAETRAANIASERDHAHLMIGEVTSALAYAGYDGNGHPEIDVMRLRKRAEAAEAECAEMRLRLQRVVDAHSR